MRLTIFLLALAVSTAARAAEPEIWSMVELGPNGQPVARLITTAATCPMIRIDGHDRPMQVRVGPATMPLRPSISKPEETKPASFPVLACDASLPPGARQVSVGGRPLPAPPHEINRIVVIGDTGCRLKSKEVQPCNDPMAYPFAKVAERAAAWKPDVVLHVGDYLYRETACPADQPGCAGSPWGYGWDSWNADFFTPGAPLLGAAPWIVVRGNHENCNRAGQGWWRYLDPQPFVPGRDCGDPSKDFTNDDAPPYAVPLGGGAQIVVMDLAFADESKPIDLNDPHAALFRSAYAKIDSLSRKASFTFLATHKPILGFSASQKAGTIKLRPGNRSIQAVFASLNPNLLPDRIDTLLAGHYHVWEQVSFTSHHPSQFIAGMSGTQEDIVPMPETLSADASPAPGAKPDHFSSWINGFGYMTLERHGARRWDVKVWNLAGEVVNTCTIDGRHSVCDKAQVH